jgi:hypothetical protein
MILSHLASDRRSRILAELLETSIIASYPVKQIDIAAPRGPTKSSSLPVAPQDRAFDKPCATIQANETLLSPCTQALWEAAASRNLPSSAHHWTDERLSTAFDPVDHGRGYWSAGHHQRIFAGQRSSSWNYICTSWKCMREARCEMPENTGVERRTRTADFRESQENGEFRGFT